MDVYEATRIVLSRIQNLDPENATKIMGLLLLQDHGDKEMIRLAFGSESLLHSLVLKAHKDLGLNSRFMRQPKSLSELQLTSDELNSPSSFKSVPFGGLVDEFKLDDQLNVQSNGGSDVFYSDGSSDDMLSQRNCVYFARGHCKSGSTCRFIHEHPEDTNTTKMDAAVNQQYNELLMRSRMSTNWPYSPTGSPSLLSPSTPSKSLSFFIHQQQQQESQSRFAAAMVRARLDPVARQIYLTFPADSSFREEDVSNYFSIYGPVQDVRIPYQQKRMFGFVAFVYPETVKLVLAKGNPHFVCDSRVLVKPYKEKGKASEKKQQQYGERGECSPYTTPNGLSFDSRGDAFDFQQFGAKMIYNANSSHELMMRRKLEAQQQALELQKAIELQQRRFTGLQLHDLKNRNVASTPVPINTINPTNSGINNNSSSAGSSNGSSFESSSPDDKSPNGSAAMDKKANSCNGILKETTIVGADKQESYGEEEDPKDDGDYEQSFGHNLPDSPFASPKKSSFTASYFGATEANRMSYNKPVSSLYGIDNGNACSGHNLVASKILPTSSTLDVAPYESCFQMPRFSDHGAIRM